MPRVARVEAKHTVKPAAKKKFKKAVKVEETKPEVVEESLPKKPRVKKVVPAVEETPAEVAPVEEKK